MKIKLAEQFLSLIAYQSKTEENQWHLMGMKFMEAHPLLSNIFETNEVTKLSFFYKQTGPFLDVKMDYLENQGKGTHQGLKIVEDEPLGQAMTST